MSSPWFLVPFLIGTIAFFVTLYISIFVPQMSDTPWGEDGVEGVNGVEEEHPLRKWDSVITWVMWGSWGVAMLMRFLDRGKYVDQIEKFFS